MGQLDDWVSIGELAQRSGVATSALRFYESRGLIRSERTDGNQRRYRRATLRLVATIRAAQTVGLTLDEIEEALATLPTDQVPDKSDWERLSNGWRDALDRRIARLQALRDDLTGCIGCGCLSLRSCKLVNRDDWAAATGPGARALRA
jgi:MerR family redox-sensitive transcriptional activator SoxR